MEVRKKKGGEGFVKKLVKHWNYWRKTNKNSKFHKFLILIGFMSCPSFDIVVSAYKYWENKKRGKL